MCKTFTVWRHGYVVIFFLNLSCNFEIWDDTHVTSIRYYYTIFPCINHELNSLKISIFRTCLINKTVKFEEWKNIYIRIKFSRLLYST